jgi:hypothetical protein
MEIADQTVSPHVWIDTIFDQPELSLDRTIKYEGRRGTATHCCRKGVYV